MSHNVFTDFPAVARPAAVPPSASRRRSLRTKALTVATAGLLGASVSACQDADSDPKAADDTPTGSAPRPTETVAAKTYTAQQLQQALLTKVAGYDPMGAPISGEYGKLKPVQDFKAAQSRLQVSPAHCADAAKGALASPAIAGAASAVVSMFGKGGQSFSEAMLAVSPGTARYLVDFEVPKGCRTFRARSGNQSTTNKVLVNEAGRIGEGSRVVGVSVQVGSTQTRTWSVSVRGQGYVVTATLIGPKATRAEVERLAGQAYQQAERTLG